MAIFIILLDGEELMKSAVNPGDDFFREILKPYYIVTADGQYLFASTQPGRRPDRAFYMVPESYKLGKGQQPFDAKAGKKIFEAALRYLENVKKIEQYGIQGEGNYKTGLKVTVSIENPHSAYIAWMGKLMIFPPDKSMEIDCHNYIIPEQLPAEFVEEIKEAWPEYDPSEPLTLYDFMKMKNNVRRVVSLGVDYFGGAYKKPNLTMVWNRGECDGLVSYHAGCTSTRVLKGLSGTGKTTLTVGPELEQDDALLGKPIFEGSKIEKVELIGLEAASFAKSEGLKPGRPEWPGLMKSKEIGESGKRPVVLAMNIDCEGVEFRTEDIAGYKVKVPRQIEGKEIGSLQCRQYEKSGTTNGRFIFQFSELNPSWGSGKRKYMKVESLSFKRFDVLEPILRVTDPVMAVALDSACESVITSAVSGKVPGTRVRSYAATDFMVGEQSRQALLKLKMYSDLGDRLTFFINNAGYVGEYGIDGKAIGGGGQGEKIRVQDSKKLISLIENNKIKNWIENPIYGYLIPQPKELEEAHGMEGFGKRFNPLNYYKAEEFIDFAKRDIEERTSFLQGLFSGQEGEDELQPVINSWKSCKIPSVEGIKRFYSENYTIV